jgi:acylphosphatase
MVSPKQESHSRIHLIVRGRVQGVGFRYSTISEARPAGLRGWVRNLPTGEVEIVAEGPRDRLERLHQWAMRGPAGARVENVEVQWRDATGEFDDFRMRR